MALHEPRLPLLLEGRQRPPLPVPGRPREPAQGLEVLLEVGEDEGELGAVAAGADAVALPGVALLGGRQGGAAREQAGGVDGLPLEDLEGEAGADGADEEQRRARVAAPHHVLPQPRHAVVAHRHLRQERQRPGVASAEDEVVDPADRRAVHEVHRPRRRINPCYGGALVHPRVLESFVSEVRVRVAPHHDGVDRQLRALCQIDCDVGC